MTAVAFDTLKLARKLRDGAQMPQEQAEGVADALAEAMSGAELATKSDLAAMKHEIMAELRELELKVDARFEAVNGRFDALDERIERRAAEADAKSQAVKHDLLRWVLVIGVSTILTIVGAAWTLFQRLPVVPLPPH
jgi:hypothetical protein